MKIINKFESISTHANNHSGGKLSRRSFLGAATCAPLILLLPQDSYAMSVIHHVTGEVFLNKKLLNPQSNIKSGNEIAVAHDGQLIFSMGGDAFLVRGGTVITVHHEKNNPLVSTLRLLTGALLAVFDKRQHPTMLVTNTATIGIRGTAVYLDSQPHQLYTCTCYGRTTLQAGGHAENVVATHHAAHTVTQNSNGSMQMQAFEVIGHTDDELRMLEALVGRKPLFDG